MKLKIYAISLPDPELYQYLALLIQSTWLLPVTHRGVSHVLCLSLSPLQLHNTTQQYHWSSNFYSWLTVSCMFYIVIQWPFTYIHEHKICFLFFMLCIHTYTYTSIHTHTPKRKCSYINTTLFAILLYFEISNSSHDLLNWFCA